MSPAEKKQKGSRRTIAYVTGTRADFGLMTPVLRAIAETPGLAVNLYATGEHLLPELGETVGIVLREFPDASVLPATIRSDERGASVSFASELMACVAAAFAERRPDMALLLGDRVEMLALALSCLYLGIPVVHLHGGERTATVDETARHAITKLSHIHLPATDEAALRIERTGEEAWRIHVVGAPALDVIRTGKLPSREDALAQVGIKASDRFVLVAMHPMSDDVPSARSQMATVLNVSLELGLPLVVVYPHADPGGRAMIAAIEMARANPLVHAFPSVEHALFLALEREAAVWIGNSSAALIESASFCTPVVNVGPRQGDRLRGANVIDAPCEPIALRAALARALNDAEYRRTLCGVTNPWGDGRSSPRVAKLLAEIPIDQRLLSKRLAY